MWSPTRIGRECSSEAQLAKPNASIRGAAKRAGIPTVDWLAVSVGPKG